MRGTDRSAEAARGSTLKRIKAKRKCCKSKPRCERCPVVCKRLAAAGYLERESKRRWVVTGRRPKKKVLKAARS